MPALTAYAAPARAVGAAEDLAGLAPTLIDVGSAETFRNEDDAPTQAGWPGGVGSTNNHLLNRNSGKCADVWYASTGDGAAVNSGNCNSGTNQQWVPVPGGSTADGATADQWTCDGGTHQLWRKTAAIGGYVTFTNVNSGLCLQVAGAATTNGAALSQSRCNGGVNQQWLVV